MAQIWQFLPGDLLAGWSDGGFHEIQGGTAAYVICLRRDGRWMRLACGGIFDSMTDGNDSMRMEAIFKYIR